MDWMCRNGRQPCSSELFALLNTSGPMLCVGFKAKRLELGKLAIVGGSFLPILPSIIIVPPHSLSLSVNHDCKKWPSTMTNAWEGNGNGDQYPMLRRLGDRIEEKTGIQRHLVAYGLLGLVALFLVIAGGAAQFVCNLIGLAYPAYASVSAIRSANTKDDTKWLTYWTVFAFLSLADLLPSQLQLFPYIQIYWLFKALLLSYLALPENKIAVKIFRHWVDPAILFCEVKLGKELPVMDVETRQ